MAAATRAPLAELRNGCAAPRSCHVSASCDELRALAAHIERAPAPRDAGPAGGARLAGGERTLAALALHAWRRGCGASLERKTPQSLKPAAPVALPCEPAPPAAGDEDADEDADDDGCGAMHARRAAAHRALSGWRREASHCARLRSAAAALAIAQRRRLLRAAFEALRLASARARRAVIASSHARRRRAATALLLWRSRCEWQRWKTRALSAAVRHRGVALRAAAWVTWHEAARSAQRRAATADDRFALRKLACASECFAAWRAQGAAAEARAVPAAWRSRRLKRCALLALRHAALDTASATAAAYRTHAKRRAAACLRGWAAAASSRRSDRNSVAIFRHKAAQRSAYTAFALWAAAAPAWAAASRRRGAALALAVARRARRAWLAWRSVAAAPRLILANMQLRRVRAALDAWRDAAAQGLVARLRADAADRLWARRAGGKALIGWAVAAAAGSASRRADATAAAFAKRWARRRGIAAWRAGVAACVRERALTRAAEEHASRCIARRALRGWRAALAARLAADAALQAALRRFASPAAEGEEAPLYWPSRRDRPQPRRPAWLGSDETD